MRLNRGPGAGARWWGARWPLGDASVRLNSAYALYVIRHLLYEIRYTIYATHYTSSI